MESEAYVITGSSLTCQIVNNFFSINGYNSDLMPVDCRVPQSSILGPLLFFIYIKDLYKQFNTAKCITLLIMQIFFI